MTLSAIGDAETPAGGSVCIRYVRHHVSWSYQRRKKIHVRQRKGFAAYLEIAHEASASGGRHNARGETGEASEAFASVIQVVQECSEAICFRGRIRLGGGMELALLKCTVATITLWGHAACSHSYREATSGSPTVLNIDLQSLQRNPIARPARARGKRLLVG